MAIGNREHRYFDRAFELAYSIHVNKEIAFFVAEDALDGLSSMLARQEKNRKPSKGLRGFLKWGERARPLRKTLELNEQQMLQWLVYKHSESWERQTERGEGLYLPTEEDLIVRFIEYLVFTTLRRGSFYVTLAIGSLLRQFDRRETRLFYDILTQSDSARMKDTSYIGKQRLEVLERVAARFGDMVEIANAPGNGKQFVMRPVNPQLINLVNESLRRFAPWDSACVIKPEFDVTDIPGLYFSETGLSDEEMIEMNRIHTVLDPVCFARFADGLAKYVRTLPDSDQDKNCNYDSPDKRIAVPQFSNYKSGTPRADRFQSPQLMREDYIRLQRTLDARAHRRKSFSPQQLCIYVDNILSYSFDLKTTKRAQCRISSEALFIEVRGRDEAGELTLVILPLCDDNLTGGEFKDSIVHPGGQKITVRLTHAHNRNGAGKGAQLEVGYAEPRWMRSVSRLIQKDWPSSNGLRSDHNQETTEFEPSFVRWKRVGVAFAVLIIAASALIWWWMSSAPPRQEVKHWEQTVQQQSEEHVEGNSPAPSITPPSLPKKSPPSKELNALFARAAWNSDREAALRAIQVEQTRAEAQTINLSRGETKLFLSLPIYDNEGRIYSSYHLILSAADATLWQQTLSAPKAAPTGYARTLALSLLSRQLPKTDLYDLQIEGRTQSGWQPLGHIRLNLEER